MGWFTSDCDYEKLWEDWSKNLREIIDIHTSTLKLLIETDRNLAKVMLSLNERIEKLEKKEKEDETIERTDKS